MNGNCCLPREVIEQVTESHAIPRFGFITERRNEPLLSCADSTTFRPVRRLPRWNGLQPSEGARTAAISPRIYKRYKSRTGVCSGSSNERRPVIRPDTRRPTAGLLARKPLLSETCAHCWRVPSSAQPGDLRYSYTDRASFDVRAVRCEPTDCPMIRSRRNQSARLPFPTRCRASHSQVTDDTSELESTTERPPRELDPSPVAIRVIGVEGSE